MKKHTMQEIADFFDCYVVKFASGFIYCMSKKPVDPTGKGHWYIPGTDPYECVGIETGVPDRQLDIIRDAIYNMPVSVEVCEGIERVAEGILERKCTGLVNEIDAAMHDCHTIVEPHTEASHD